MNQKVALVTGGTGGIGTAICETLSKEGYTVIASSSSQKKADTWLAEQKTKGFDMHTAVADLTNESDAQAMIADIKDRVGNISILVNNAGITQDGMFKKMTSEKWLKVINTNLNSVFFVTRAIINDMLDAGYGRIVNISSINGQKGQMGQTNYSSSKAGLHGFTMALAQETARKGITVNTISPGYIATEMVMAIAEEVRNKIIEGIPLGRLGTPKEIARIVAFLAHEDSGYITGSNIAANGGQFMH